MTIPTFLTFRSANGDGSGNNDRSWTVQVSARMGGSNPADIRVVWQG